MKDYSPYLALISILISAATFPVGLGGIPPLIMLEVSVSLEKYCSI
ncbi:hypothetical protein BVRB_6g147060 [Beta vulgaris subsp. vulgaris]|nr:hypothetical protein BVRB_6g147060 [Beta vulgaris subsp. vulgaris]